MTGTASRHTLYMREYSKRPEVRAKKLAYMAKYRNKPEVAKRQKEYLEDYRCLDHVKAKKAAYQKRPDVRAKRNESKIEYNSRDYVKEKLRAYRRADRHKATKRAWRERNKLRQTMSVAISTALSKNKAGRSWKSLVPYTLDDLRSHLERQFTKGMTWNNYGSFWHVDHIIPLYSFTYSTPEEPDFKAAWALTNLRPMRAIENMKKGPKRTLLL